MSRNNSLRLGQTETMTRNNQDEKKERLNRLLKRNNEYNNNLDIPKDKEVDVIEFAEQYLGFKLSECQKELLKSIKENNWNTIGFSPAHSYSYSYQSVMMEMVKELIKRKEKK